MSGRPYGIWIVVLAALLGGCRSSDSVDNEVVGDTLTVYASLPLQGAQAVRGEAAVNGAKLALADAGGVAGAFKVNSVYLNDAAGRPARWDAATTAGNARRASQDTRSIGFIGDLDSGAVRFSLPITNQAGILELSPGAPAVDLTRGGPGTDAGDPERFYPTGRRTFGRLQPADDLQAAAAARWARSLDARRVLAVSDGSGFGRGLAAAFRARARSSGLADAGTVTARPGTARPRDAAIEAAARHPDLVYYAGEGGPPALRLLRALGSRLPRSRLMASDALLDPGPPAGLGPATKRLFVTSPALPADRLGPAGRRFAKAYRREFGSAPDPYAAYGYEAMAAILGAVKRAGKDGRDRRAVVRAFLATRNRRSILGTYSIDPETGESSLRRIAGYRVRRGRPVFDRLLSGR